MAGATGPTRPPDRWRCRSTRPPPTSSDDTEHAANLFALKEFGNIYTRIMNPTNDVLEERIAALEGGVAALARELGPGGVGDGDPEHRAGRRQHRQLDRPLWRHLEPVRQHAEGTWASRCASSIRPTRRTSARATDDKTRAYYAETLPNPKLHVFPIEEVADIGRSLGVPLIMDNTACPILCRPFEHGAAIVVYSTTKYIGGHGTSIGGVIVDGGNFDWEKHAERFPMLNQPDPSYHGAVWTEAVKPLGPIAYIIKARVTLLRDLGACDEPVQRLPVHPGAGDAAAAHARALPECRRRWPTTSTSIRRSPSVIHPGLHDRRADAARRRLSQGRLWRRWSASS